MKHLKKEDGIPLWRKDIQYDFLRLVFYDKTRCFTKYSDKTKGHTFAEIYIDAMAKSSKCSKILKEKLLADTEGAISMAMVCLLVNVGRMNTTLNFFPEMRAQLRTYHSIPALQAHQDPNAYKQLQDAPRLKSILKGATEDEPQPSTLEEIKAASIPRTNPVNLIFVMSQYAPKISETNFNAPRDFFDLVVRDSLSSESRARAFLWLIWWYLESDFSYEDSQRNPFGPGQYGEGEEGSGSLPEKVPTLESLTEEQAALENVDTEDERRFGGVKQKERIAILASEPSPAMTALKRARKEKGLTSGGPTAHASDDEASETGWQRGRHPGRHSGLPHDTGSEYTRSPSPAAGRGFQPVNSSSKPAGDMRINNLLNDDMGAEVSPPHVTPTVKKGPGRGNWRRNKNKQESVPLSVRGAEGAHHVPLLPNTGQYNFAISEQAQPATPGGMSHQSPQHNTSTTLRANRDHIPTPSYQAQKRHRGITQHQSAIISHRKQQVIYRLDRRIRMLHARARDQRESEGSILRAWKRLKMLPAGYDSDEEYIKIRKARDRAEKGDDFHVSKGKENLDILEDLDVISRPKVLMAGLGRVPREKSDAGEEAKMLAQLFRRASRRLERWEDTDLPGSGMIRRRQLEAQGLLKPSRHRRSRRRQYAGIVEDSGVRRHSMQRQRATNKQIDERRDEMTAEVQQCLPEVRDGFDGGELDEEDRELLNEVDADESEEDEDEEMVDE